MMMFDPCSSGGSGGPQAAKDRLGNDVRASAWLEEHGPGDRSLVQGLQVRQWQRQAAASGGKLGLQVWLAGKIQPVFSSCATKRADIDSPPAAAPVHCRTYNLTPFPHRATPPTWL